MKLGHTRAMVRAAVAGQLDHVDTVEHPIFGLRMPVAVEGVPAEVLDPRRTWESGEAYDAQATRLAGMFHENIRKFGDAVKPAILAAGPRR
jgi:phosphoenolpyruvate carboxykinase (ATP)